MRTLAQQVNEFHAAIDHPTAEERPRPSLPALEERALRVRFIVSEFTELMLAMCGLPVDDEAASRSKASLTAQIVSELNFAEPEHVNLAEIARQVADLHYVLSGTSLTYGFPEDEVIAEVHRANMEKVGGPKRDDGKQLPPEGWTPPDIAAILEAHS
jgi:predicted HAD superfamily Cof-like phosphohydrolase